MEHSIETEGELAKNVSSSWAQVSAIVTAIDTTLGKWLLDNYGIGLTEHQALVHLSRTFRHELRITELAKRVGLNQSSVTRLVGRMETKKLAYRDTCPDDGRGVYAVITEHGLLLIREIKQPYEEKIGELLQNAARNFPQLNLTNLERSFHTISTLIK